MPPRPSSRVSDAYRFVTEDCTNPGRNRVLHSPPGARVILACMDERELRIALLDDDPEIRQLVSAYLARYQIECVTVGSAAEFFKRLGSEHFDLVLLDIMLPDGDGLDIARQVRQTNNIPVIMLTALADESDRVLGLEMGADDYLTKPFSPRELLARIRAVLRRTSEQLWVHRQTDVQTYCFADWRLSLAQRTLTSPQGVLISLTGGEFDLLVALVRNAGSILNRDQLLEMTRGRSAQAYDRSVDVQLSRLRKKLGDVELIKTVRGGGYLFAQAVTHE